MISNNVSIVIPMFYYENSKECLDNLNSQIYPGKHELILVCDNPKNEIPSWFKEYENVKLIKHETNMGLAKSYNDGISNSKYENILLFHEDCVPTSNCLINNMICKMQDGYDVVNAMLMVPQEIFDSLNFWGKIMLFRYMGRKTQALGKASLFNKEVFNKVGLFDDETFRTSGEDCEFNLRMDKNEIKTSTVEDLVNHNHKINNANWKSVIKKEIQMGQGHGATKRKYPFKILGKFDLEYRIIILILGIILLLFADNMLKYLGVLFIISPPILISMMHARDNYHFTNWFKGSMTYLLIGPIIYFIQMYSGIKSFIKGRQTI